ncbi:hypothetical protein RhiJN_15037 [Ceratobasidium sp. AG-Ba]|nr:hypothetical protein RhiJN_15037 [Ceratobasidium sp. AG-Ba]
MSDDAPTTGQPLDHSTRLIELISNRGLPFTVSGGDVSAAVREDSNGYIPVKRQIRKLYPYWSTGDFKQCRDLLAPFNETAYYDSEQPCYSGSTASALKSFLDYQHNIHAHATGAVVYTVAVWEEDRNLHTFEITSPQILHMLSRDLFSKIRRRFTTIVQTELGPTMIRDMSLAFPSVCTVGDFDFRPFLPPQVDDMPTERWVLYRLIIIMRDWQALPDINWAVLKDDTLHRHSRYIEAPRIPPNVQHLCHPSDISADMYRKSAEAVPRQQAADSRLFPQI